MAWLDKVKGMLVEDEAPKPGTPQPQVQPPQNVAQRGGGIPMTMPTGTYAAAPMQPVLNEAFVNAIRKATFSRNTALTALITASDALVDIIPDPVMRLKAAHKTAGAGRNPKEIADAVAIHLNDVDSEVMRFKQTLETKIKQEVGGLNGQSTAAATAAENAQREIQALTERLSVLQQTVGAKTAEAQQLAGEAQQKEGELRRAETEFEAAAIAVRNELNAHKSTIMSTLG